MSENKSLFEETLSGLEAGLQVRLIAVSLVETCTVSDDAKAVLTKFSDFTCIPVRVHQDGPIVGVLEQSETLPQGAVEQHMRPLDGSMLISAGAPLSELIPLLGQFPYRLVVTKGGIEGIVTPSDLQKLPVRLYTFALITHLEMLMMKIIQQRTTNDQQWRDLLSYNKLAKIEERRQRLRAKDRDLPLLELTEFWDKQVILAKLLQSEEDFSPPDFEKDLEEIRDLRNAIDHVESYADDGQDGQNFIACHQKINDWIKRLSPYLEA